MHWGKVHARRGVFDGEVLAVQSAADFAGARIHRGHVLILGDASGLIGEQVSPVMEMACFSPHKPLSYLVGLPHLIRQGF